MSVAAASGVVAWAGALPETGFGMGLVVQQPDTAVPRTVTTFPGLFTAPDLSVGIDAAGRAVGLYSRCAVVGGVAAPSIEKPIVDARRPPTGCDIWAVDLASGAQKPVSAVNTSASEYHPVLDGGRLAYVRSGGSDKDSGTARPRVHVLHTSTGKDVVLKSGSLGTSRAPNATERARGIVRRAAGMGPVKLALRGKTLAVRWHSMKGRRSIQQILVYRLPTTHARVIAQASQAPIEGVDSESRSELSEYRQLVGPAVSSGRVWWATWGTTARLRSATPAGRRKASRSIPGLSAGQVPADLALSDSNAVFSAITPAAEDICDTRDNPTQTAPTIGRCGVITQSLG